MKPHKCGRRHRSRALAQLCEREAVLQTIAKTLGYFAPSGRISGWTIHGVTERIDRLLAKEAELAELQALTPTRLQAKNAALSVEIKALRTRDRFWQEHYEQLRRETHHLRALPKPPGGK